MRNYLFALLVAFLSTSVSVFADSTDQADGAQVLRSTFCPFFVIVDPGVLTPILPGGYGIMVTNLDADGQLVISGSGNQTLNCQGAVQEGETIWGVDALNPTGPVVSAVVSPAYEACVANNMAFPGTCKGTGTFVVTGDDVEAGCNVAGVFTRDWQQVTSRSGQYNLKCRILN